MQFHFFTVPIHSPDDAADALNRFLATHCILAIDRQFVSDGPNSAWTVCLSFDDGNAPTRPAFGKRGKVDFKDVLSDAEFAVFAAQAEALLRLADAPPPSWPAFA